MAKQAKTIHTFCSYDGVGRHRLPYLRLASLSCIECECIALSYYPLDKATVN